MKPHQHGRYLWDVIPDIGCPKHHLVYLLQNQFLKTIINFIRRRILHTKFKAQHDTLVFINGIWANSKWWLISSKVFTTRRQWFYWNYLGISCEFLAFECPKMIFDPCNIENCNLCPFSANDTDGFFPCKNCKILLNDARYFHFQKCHRIVPMSIYLWVWRRNIRSVKLYFWFFLLPLKK